MTTEISPMFGLSLLELVEWFTILTPIAIFTAAAITGVFSWWSIRQSNKRMAEQLESQNKIASAKLILELLKKWDGRNTLTLMIYKLEKPNAEFTDKDDGVHFVLGIFENIAILRKDGTLAETHVREFFGTDIVRIDANESVMGILNDYHHEDTEHNYNNLKNMLDDSKKWGIKPYSLEELSSDSS